MSTLATAQLRGPGQDFGAAAVHARTDEPAAVSRSWSSSVNSRLASFDWP
jgi:hypothetical protein